MTIAVRVVDTANAPIVGADVSVVRGVSAAVAHAATNASGRTWLSVPRADGDFQVEVRKIGFQRGYRFFTLPAADTMSMEIRLLRSVVSLAPVNITATEDLKRKSYHLDAEDIKNSSRAIIDGTDIFKLRPDMKTSRGGAMACAVAYTPRDGWIESVWINGRRAIFPYVDADYVKWRKASLGIRTPPPPPPKGRRAPPSLVTDFTHTDTVLSILRDIKPEHIAEITYHDCFDASIGKNHSDMAMFIVLKPGIGYKDGIGSYVLADEAPKSAPIDTVP